MNDKMAHHAENDFGRILYGECRLNATMPQGDWSFVFEDVPDGSGGFNTTDKISLRNLEALKELGDVWTGDATTDIDTDIYINRPEIACFSICRTVFEDDCSIFAFDGVQNQTCDSSQLARSRSKLPHREHARLTHRN